MNLEIISGTMAKKADLYAMHVLHLHSLDLMQCASETVYSYIKDTYAPRTVLIVCGVGNNGADGVCIGRIFLQHGVRPAVTVCGDLRKASWEFLYQLAEYRRMDGQVLYYATGMPLPEADVLVDAVFGIGLKRPVEGLYRAFIEAAETADRKHTVSVDIPSGVDADTGERMGCAIHADATVTFGRNKTGLVQGQGPEYAGDVIIRDIGIPDSVYSRIKSVD